VAAAVIDTLLAFEEKQELLQLMKDMLQVTAETKDAPATDIDMKYLALKVNT
jgi:hypothetical protein